MALRHLYLRIYLTMLAVLLVFALVAGVLVRRHTESERGRIESAVSELASAWAQLLGNSLPPADAPPAQQAASLRDWSERLRLPLALDAADGQRLATSESYAQLERAAGLASEGAALAWPGPARAGSVQRVPLADGRGLWVGRPPRPDRGPPWVGPPGLRPDKFARPDPGGPPPPDAQGDGPAPRLHWRAPRWLDDAGVLLGLLGVLFVAVAASAWPVVRRLTRRLESLQRGVEVFGSGQLGHRVPEGGRDEVATLAASFNRAAERIEKLVQANRSLLANASHELRSPLARLKMALAVLEGAAPARRDELRREIDRNIRELDTLVEEVLLASRLDASHRLQRETVDLLGLLAEEAARVDAEVEGEALTLPGDERLLRRALRNLLENARRYGGDEVLATLHAVPGGGVEVRVCDRGPGVPEAYRERVFEPFFRLPGHAEREGGVGLGLSLVRQIAEQHGGQVHCEAREGGGTCFRLNLPGPG